MPLVVHDFGVDLAVHEDFALAAVEVGRIGYAGAGVEPQERSVGKAQFAALARRHEHLLPFGSVRGLGVEERDGDQQRDDQHGGDPLRPPDDGRQTARCAPERNGRCGGRTLRTPPAPVRGFRSAPRRAGCRAAGRLRTNCRCRRTIAGDGPPRRRCSGRRSSPGLYLMSVCSSLHAFYRQPDAAGYYIKNKRKPRTT